MLRAHMSSIAVRYLLTTQVFAFTFFCLADTASADDLSAEPKGFTEISGRLEDQTRYLIRRPTAWNGVVIGDLDFVKNADGDFYKLLLKRGFALTGTLRREDRFVNLSMRRDVERIQEVLGIFRAKFRAPERTIIFGCSAGGGAALVTAEAFPDTTDGVIATCATTPLLSGNHRFDFLFLLKAVLGPDDPSLLVHPIPEHFAGVVERWEEVVSQALLTRAGQAKIAFAFTAAQFPIYGKNSKNIPPPEDPNSTQVVNAMMASVVPALENIVANLRQLNINPAPMVWNDGADYEQYFNNGDPFLKTVVTKMYREAGLDLGAQLDRLHTLPRTAMDPVGTAAWFDAPMQMHRGSPSIPVFHMHVDGDQVIAQEQSQVYIDNVKRNGLNNLLRTATVHRAGHCNFTTSERLVALEVMMRRLETGDFGDTSPEQLNALAASFDTGEESAFISRQLRPFNGAWRVRELERYFGTATRKTLEQ